MSLVAPLRGAARSVVEIAGTATGVAALARRLRVGRATVLAYHNVVRPGDAGRGDSSLHLPLPAFLEQVEWLRRTHRVVGLDTAAEGPRGDGRPQAVITFDDAYRGAVTTALPELARRGLPATVFVSPGLLGADGTWWDEMAEAGVLSPQLRTGCLEELAGRGAAIRNRVFAGRRAPDLPESYGIATAEELRAHRSEGITVGSHAWDHEYLPALGDDALRSTLSRALAWLEGADVPTTSWLALPYGAGEPRTIQTALDLGHAGVLRISGGLWGADRAPAGAPRINIPAGLSLRGLRLRAAGLRT